MTRKQRKTIKVATTIAVIWAMLFVASTAYLVSVTKYIYLDFVVDRIDAYGEKGTYTAKGWRTYWDLDEDGSLKADYNEALGNLNTYVEENGVAYFFANSGTYFVGKVIRLIITLEALAVFISPVVVIILLVESEKNSRYVKKPTKRKCYS